MRSMNRTIFTIILIFLNIAIKGWAYSVRVLPPKIPVPLKISLYHDSLLVSSFSSRDSIIQLPNVDFERIKIDAMGFKSVNRLWPVSTTSLNVTMEETSQTLNEVVVYADATLKEEGVNTTITNLSNSYLAEFGSLNNGLEWVPGLMKLESGKIVIPDYGEPIIYVDGRRLSSQSELNAIPTKEVAQIKILRDPGAAYPPGTKCVIDIKLHKHLSDYVSLSPSVRLTQRSLPGVNTSIGLLFSTQKLSGSASASYNHSGSQPKENQFTKFNDNNSSDYTMKQESHNLMNSVSLSGGLAYTLNSDSRIQIQYAGDLKHSNRFTIGSLQMNRYNPESSFRRKSCNFNNIHNVSLGYYMETDATSLSVSAAYNAIRRGENACYNNTEQILYTISNPTNYDSFLSYCEFSHESPYGLFTGGYNLAISNTKINYTQNGASTNTHNRAYNFSPYFGYEKTIHKFTIQGAISYAYDKMHYYLPSPFLKTYNVVMPSLSVKYKIKKKNITLAYRNTSEFPSYYELNPIKEQIDSLNYYQGNPHLKYCRNHNLTLSAGSFNGITTSLSYTWHNNSVTDVLMLNPSSSLIGVYMPMNVGRYKKVRFNISYNLWRKNFNIYASSSLDYSHINYPIGISKPSTKNISALLMLNCRYTIAGKYNIFTNSWYRTPYITTNQKIDYTLGVNIGVSTSLLSKRLTISFTASDVFNRAVSPSTVTSWYSNSIRTSEFNYDGRALSLTLSYTLNHLKTKFKKTDDYDDFINRAASRK